MHSTFGVAYLSIRTSLELDEWAVFNSVPGEVPFATDWEAYKGDLAGHLTWDEWRKVEGVASAHMALRAMSQESLPTGAAGPLGEVRDGLLAGRDVLRPYCVSRLSVWMLSRRRLRLGKK